MSTKYLGDGLYFEDQVFQIKLFTAGPGLNDTENEVFLDDYVLLTMFKAIEASRLVKITISKPEEVN